MNYDQFLSCDGFSGSLASEVAAFILKNGVQLYTGFYVAHKTSSKTALVLCFTAEQALQVRTACDKKFCRMVDGTFHKVTCKAYDPGRHTALIARKVSLGTPADKGATP